MAAPEGDHRWIPATCIFEAAQVSVPPATRHPYPPSGLSYQLESFLWLAAKEPQMTHLYCTGENFIFLGGYLRVSKPNHSRTKLRTIEVLFWGSRK